MSALNTTSVPLYAADPRLSAIHSWVRGNIADGLKPAPTQFQAQFTAGTGLAYYEGVASLAAVYFVLGTLLFVLFATVNLSAFCCRSAIAKRRRGCLSRLLACACAPTYWYIGACALMGVLAAVAISQAVAFKNTVRERMGEGGRRRQLLRPFTPATPPPSLLPHLC